MAGDFVRERMRHSGSGACGFVARGVFAEVAHFPDAGCDADRAVIKLGFVLGRRQVV